MFPNRKLSKAAKERERERGRERERKRERELEIYACRRKRGENGREEKGKTKRESRLHQMVTVLDDRGNSHRRPTAATFRDGERKCTLHRRDCQCGNRLHSRLKRYMVANRRRLLGAPQMRRRLLQRLLERIGGTRLLPM